MNVTFCILRAWSGRLRLRERLGFELGGWRPSFAKASQGKQVEGGRVSSLVGADVPAARVEFSKIQGPAFKTARPEVGPYLADTYLSPVFMQKEVRLSRFQSWSYAGGHSC
jgi:hypothetical protein